MLKTIASFTRLSLAALFLFAAGANAQDATGKITGIVTDPSGAAMPAVKVTVMNVATNNAHNAVTDASGFYQVLQLPIGRYRVTAETTGFQTTTIDSPTALEINRTLRIDVQLAVGAVTSAVTVEGNASVVETENQTIGDTVTGRAIFELPLNGRNTLDLIGTMPGVTPTNPDSGAAGNYSVGGGRTDSVTYLLDGGLNNDLLSNQAVVNPNPDAVAEFRVLESNYSAEYGRNAGGVVSEVMKSGSNAVHGTLYDYVRNNYFDANSFFHNEQGLPVEILKRNQFGGTVGGPILIPKIVNGRNKLFFFFAYEGQRQIQDVNEGKVTTFTPAEANGDFSQSPQASTVAAYLANNPQFQSNPILASQGIIDPTKIDPVAKAYFAAGLIPTSPTGTLFPVAGAKNNYNEYDGKIDYNITSSDSLSGTFSNRDNPTNNNPFSFASVTGYTDLYDTTTYFGQIVYTHTFTPALLNEARVTAQRSNHLQAVPGGKAPTASQLGALVPSDNPTGPPLLGFLGSGLNIGYSPQGPTNEVDNTYAYYDNLSWTKGNHSLKFGFFFSPYQNNTVYDFYVNGEYYFYGPSTGVGSGFDFADFLFGAPDEFLQFGRAPSNIRSHQYSGYGQDAWRIAKRLTLTFGLRYEYAQPKFDTQGRSFSYIPGLQSQRFVNAPTGLVFPGDPGAPTGANFPDKNDFAPRFGFAYDVFGNAKTSIRGGFGVFYDVLKGEDNLQFNGQAPFFGFADIFPSAPGAGASGLQDPFGSAGVADSFPSKPPSKNLDFGASGFLPFGGSGVYFVDPHLRTPYVYQYNFSIEQQLPGSLLLEATYLGSSSHKLTGLVDVNPFVLGTNSRLNPAFSYLNEFQNIGKAHYNAGEFKLRRVASAGNFGNLFFTLGYTWSHEIDNSSGFRERNSNIPYYDHNAFYGSGDTDVRQIITFSGGWELPFHKLLPHAPRLLASGWSIYPIVSWHTGFPLDVYAGLSTSNSNPGPSGAGDAGNVRADLVGNTVGTLNPQSYQTLANPTAGSTSTGNYYFNPGAFTTTNILALNAQAKADASLLPYYTYGSFPRNGLRGPGYTDVDLAITKHFRFGEAFDLELRGDAFNVLNHTNFGNPDVNVNDATFGQVSTENAGSSATSSGARILQLALHLSF